MIRLSKQIFRKLEFRIRLTFQINTTFFRFFCSHKIYHYKFIISNNHQYAIHKIDSVSGIDVNFISTFILLILFKKKKKVRINK